jgi:hypothetical protein
MKCARPSCPNGTVKYKLCPTCRAKQRKANDRFFNRTPPTDHKCATSVCTGIATGRTIFCPFCIKVRESAQKRMHSQTYRGKNKTPPKLPATSTLRDTIAEANQMRERLSRLNPVLFAQRMGYGAIT